MATGEQRVLLVIADISGYTRFIAANRDSLAHSQIVITELMRAVLKELKLPLRISKLEGDAVFFYLRTEGNERGIRRVAEEFPERVERIFAAFDRRIAELIQSNTCPCAGCEGVKMLRLKMVIHSGTALFYRLERFTELSGFDVIVIHRLLKNSVAGDEYVLLSEAARNELFGPDEEKMFDRSEEAYDDIGVIPTYVYRPGAGRAEIPPDAYGTRFHRWKTGQIKIWGERLMGWGLVKQRPFKHLSEAGTLPLQ